MASYSDTCMYEQGPRKYSSCRCHGFTKVVVVVVVVVVFWLGLEKFKKAIVVVIRVDSCSCMYLFIEAYNNDANG